MQGQKQKMSFIPFNLRYLQYRLWHLPWTSFIGHVEKGTLVSWFIWTVSASKRAELYAGCALSLCWWGGSLVSSFIRNHLKPDEMSPVPGVVVTIARFCSAAVLALVKERKVPFLSSTQVSPHYSPHTAWAAKVRESLVLCAGDLSELSGSCQA